jgi:hypothetical protein
MLKLEGNTNGPEKNLNGLLIKLNFKLFRWYFLNFYIEISTIEKLNMFSGGFYRDVFSPTSTRNNLFQGQNFLEV